MCNRDVRSAIKDAGLKHWQVAEKYGLNDGNFSRLLRKELPEEVKAEVYKAIQAARKDFAGV